MKIQLMTATLLSGSALVASVPTVRESSVVLSQAADRTVTVSYTLEGEPAIVTLDVETNGVSIGGVHLTHLRGDVNRRVEPGARTFTWRPDKAWPGVKLDSGVRAVVKAWATNAPPDYMAVSLVTPDAYNFYENAECVPGGVTNDLYKTEWLLMRKVPSANVQWRMGSPSTEPNRTAASEAPHLVTLTKDYYLGVYELTQRQYELVYGSKGACYFNNAEEYAMRPVEKVSWVWLRGAGGYSWPGDGGKVDATKFLGKLRSHAGNRCAFDLPLEALWEFACRAGCGGALYSGKPYANYENDPYANEIARAKHSGGCGEDGTMTNPAQDVRSSVAGTAKVGTLPPNAWGFYDMAGNVSEFCLDWNKNDLTGIDPERGPDSGESRAVRGGCWNSAAFRLRSADRNSYTPNTGSNTVGFRICAPAGIR